MSFNNFTPNLGKPCRHSLLNRTFFVLANFYNNATNFLVQILSLRSIFRLFVLLEPFSRKKN